MQRRAAAAYVVLFLVIAAGAYAVIATAQAPSEAMNADEAEYSLSTGDEVTIGGRQYRVTAAGEDASLSWVNDSAIYTETWDNGTGLQFAEFERTDGSVAITFPANRTINESPPSGAQFTDAMVAANRSAALLNYTDGTDNFTATFVPMPNATVVGASVADNGSRAEVTFAAPGITSYDLIAVEEDGLRFREKLPPGVRTVEDEGITKVIVERNGTEELVPLDQYRQRLDRVRIRTADSLTYRGNETDLSSNATTGTATLTWRAPRTNVVEFSHDSNVTLNGRSFYAFSTGENSISLFENPDGFETRQKKVERANRFQERQNGLWGVVFLSLTAAVLLVSMAYLPRKDT